MTSSYQPFLISEFKTGLFNYLEPWIRPTEAFDPLSNAFIYRGTLQKRAGFTVFGRLTYQDTVTIATGNGGSVYGGTLSVFPITPGTMTVTVLTSAGLETFVSNSVTPTGTLTGSLGDTGTIVWATGVWTLTFGGGRTVANPKPIVAGYIYVPTQLTTPITRPIMGLKLFTNEATSTNKLVGADTRRAAVYNDSTNSFDPLSTVSQTLWVGDNATTSITISTGWANVAPYSVTISDGVNSITDNGTGGFPTSGNLLNTSTVTYTTGVILLNITAPNTRTYTITMTLQGNYFNGANSNFFNSTNWLGNLYLTNNVDRITLFDGTNLSRPPFPITQAHKVTFTNDITTCLDLDVYKNRLLVQRPIVIPNSTPDAQSIRFSAINNPTNLVADVSGNGGEISAPTDDFMQSSQFLRDQLIVMFSNSAWTFRFTGSDFAPFRWDKINNSKSTNAPYGTIDYDERITAMGSKGLIACDGVNVQRYDTSVIDQFLDINQNRFGQCFGLRFDTLNQSWMLYPSASNDSTTSDKVLVYNFIENSWATYDLPLSCLGLYFVTSDKTWADFAPGGSLATTWDQAEFQWNSYLLQDLAPTLLGGGLTGIVYQMNDGDTDNGTAIEASITSARWNPYVGLGQKVQFGYIDFYYEINDEAVLDLTFFIDNSSAPGATRTLTLDGPVNSDVAMKRIFINTMGEFLRLNIDSTSPANFKILGMVLWARPAGRLTP